MIDVQLLINITLFVITVLFVVVLVQVIFLLKDLKISIIKINKILEDSGEISESIKKPITGVVNLLSVFKKFKED